MVRSKRGEHSSGRAPQPWRPTGDRGRAQFAARLRERRERGERGGRRERERERERERKAHCWVKEKPLETQGKILEGLHFLRKRMPFLGVRGRYLVLLVHSHHPSPLRPLIVIVIHVLNLAQEGGGGACTAAPPPVSFLGPSRRRDASLPPPSLSSHRRREGKRTLFNLLSPQSYLSEGGCLERASTQKPQTW